jgi:hypothetical protein
MSGLNQNGKGNLPQSLRLAHWEKTFMSIRPDFDGIESHCGRMFPAGGEVVDGIRSKMGRLVEFGSGCILG